MSYFDLVTRSFKDVLITDDGIDTFQFLEATDGFINMFDLFGSPAFAVVQNDLKSNVQKIRLEYKKDLALNRTLQSLMIQETNKPGKPMATEAVLWLTRGLDFTSSALHHSLLNPTEELETSFRQAYEATLSPHHSFFVRPMFYVAVKSMPWRQDFYQTIGMVEDSNINDMKEWITSLKNIVLAIQQVFEANPAYIKRIG